MKNYLAASALQIYKFLVTCGILKSRISREIFARAYFIYKRTSEDPYQKLAQHYPELFAAGHVLDVGANIGYTSVVFANAVQAGYRVYAFEPEAENFAQLQSTISVHRLQEKIIPIAAAVGAKDESLELWINRFHPGDHRILTPNLRQKLADSVQAQKVEVISLDSFVRTNLSNQKVSFVKIDVQGYEQNVLEGMKQVLRDQPDISVSFEYHPAVIAELGYAPDWLIQFFRQQDFLLYMISNDGVISRLTDSALPDRSAVLSELDYWELLASRRTLI